MRRRSSSRRVQVIGLAAAPDTKRIDLIDNLQAFIGSGLNGRRTAIVGVDRGDPTRSLTGPIAARQDVTAAQAAVSAGGDAGYRPNTTIQDLPLTDPTLDPYNALLLARMRR